MFKRIECFIRGVIGYIRHGAFVQHLYEETREPAIIIATENSFRVSDNFQHEPNETVYKNATLINLKCIRCGHTISEWEDNDEKIPII